MARRIKRAIFKFQPFSPKQKKILTWWLPESGVSHMDGIIADGAIRSGKTVSMALSFVFWAMSSFQEQNFGMCGKTIGSFRRNVLAVLKVMLWSRGYKVKDRRADNLVEITRKGVTNYFYVFGGKDESSQDLVQGITLAGVFFDEVALMPESFVNQATGRCSVAGSKFWFNCNPDGPEHWFKKNWIDDKAKKRLLYLHFTMEDNWSLSEEIKARYRSMYVGVFYERYILGLWKVAEGLVYTMFDRAAHVIDKAPETGDFYISVDYGTRNPFSAGLWCVNGRKAYRIKEYYYDSRARENHGKQHTDEEYYQELVKLAGDRVIQYIVIDPSAASMIEAINRHGKFDVRKAKNDVVDGIRVTASLLQAGMLLIHESCVDTIREFGLYSWDEKAKEDKVVKENDHAMDDIRYFANTVLRREFGWDDWGKTA